MTDARYYNGDYDRPHESVPEHPAEVLFRDAARKGAAAAGLLREYAASGNASVLDPAIERVIDAANFYHEALRESGECPMCGAIFTDPWGGRHYNQSYGCCVEPPEPDGEVFRGGEAAAYEREQMAHIQRTLK